MYSLLVDCARGNVGSAVLLTHRDVVGDGGKKEREKEKKNEKGEKDMKDGKEKEGKEEVKGEGMGGQTEPGLIYLKVRINMK